MFAFLVSACTASEVNLTCSLVNSSKTIFGKAGSIDFNCTGLDTNETLSAKFGSNSTNATEYTFMNITNTSGVFQFNYTEDNLTQVETMITFAAINESNSVTKFSEVAVTLLPTPVIVSVSRLNTSETIYPNTNITFNVILNQTQMLSNTSSKLEFALYDGEDKTNFTNLTVNEAVLTAGEGQNNNYTFTYRFGEPFTGTSYKLIAQFTDAANQSSGFANLTSISVMNATINCTKLEQENFDVASSSVKVNCSITGSDSMTFKASPGDAFNESKAFPCTYTSGAVSCNFTGNEEEASNVTFALISNKNSTYAQQTLDLKLIPKPEVTLDLMNTTVSNFTVGENITFNVTVTKPTMTEITGQVELVNTSSTSSISNGMNVTLTKIEGTNCYNFTYQIPNTTAAGKYYLLFQATNLVGISSDAAKRELNVTEIPVPPAPSVQCSLFGENNNFQINGTVDLQCMITGTNETTIKAKIGEEENAAANYTFICMNTTDASNGNANYTCNFTNNAMEAKKVSLALIKSENQILSKQSLDINLIPQPEIAGLDFSNQSLTHIYFGSSYDFKFNLTKPTMTDVKAYAQFVNANETDFTAGQEVALTKNDNEATFNFMIPSEETEGERKLLLKVQNMLGENSTVLSKNFSVEIKPTLTCDEPTNKYLTASGSLSLTCNASVNIVNKTFKYKFGDNNWMNATFESGKIMFNYTEQTNPVREILIGAFDNDTEIITTSVHAIVFPLPNVSKVEDAAKGKKYIAGNSITLSVTIGNFEMPEQATVKYGFVAEKNESVSTDAGKLEKSEEIYTLVVKVPENEIMETAKYIKLTITDLAGQTVNATTEEKISINQKYNISDTKIVTENSEKTEEIKYKVNDTIKFELKLSNLKEDWQNNTKFGYRIGSETAELHVVDKFDIVKAPSSNRRILETSETVSFNVTIPADVNATGKTNIYIYALDKEENIVSDPVEVTVTVDDLSAQTTPEHSGLTGGQIAAIVISVIVVILVIVIIIIAILCMKKEDNVQESEDQISDSGSGVMV